MALPSWRFLKVSVRPVYIMTDVDFPPPPCLTSIRDSLKHNFESFVMKCPNPAEGFTRSLARDLGADGIWVNWVVDGGWI